MKQFGNTIFNGGCIVSLGLWCCWTRRKNKHLTDNSCPPVELALFRRASRKVLTDVSLFSPFPPVAMLWATMLWPPVNPACSHVTMAISGCLTAMLCPLSTDWMPQVSMSLLLLTSSVRPTNLPHFCVVFLITIRHGCRSESAPVGRPSRAGRQWQRRLREPVRGGVY